MFSKLFKTGSPSQSVDRPWTKNLIVKKIADELSDLDIKANKSTLTIPGDPGLNLEFIADNYAPADRVELNASIFLKDPKGQRVLLTDLVSFGTQYYSSKYRPLSISKTENWESSHLKQELTEVYGPLFTALADKDLRRMLFDGEEVTARGQKIKLSKDSEHSWIQDAARKLV